VVYLEYQDPGSTVRVFAADGTLLRADDLPDNPDLYEFRGWLDDDRLVLQKDKAGTLLLYEPDTGELREISPSFPVPPVAGKPGSDYADVGVAYVTYNPAMTRVMYMHLPTFGHKVTYTLWDVDEKRLLWETEADTAFANSPVWSGDGRGFSVTFSPYQTDPNRIVDYGALYQIDADGQVTLLLDRTAPGFSWSPDGVNLATWWRSEYRPCGAVNALAIYDPVSRTATAYCWLTTSGVLAGQAPVWSPDGRFIAFNQYREVLQDDGILRDTRRVIVFDTREERAYTLLEGYSVQGWMKAP